MSNLSAVPAAAQGLPIGNSSHDHRAPVADQEFLFESQSVRVVVREGAPWFVAHDVCTALEIANVSDALLKLDADEKMTVGLTDGHSGKRGGARSIALVSEAGMYTLVLRCRDAVKPGTVPHRFRRWVTGEVLPSVRKTGSYERAPVTPMSMEQYRAIQNFNRSLVERAPVKKQGELITKLWGALRSEFGCGIVEIPADKFTDAISLMAETAVEWDLVGDPVGPPAVTLTPQEACDMAAFLPSMLQAREFYVEVFPALEAMKSPLIGKYEECIAMGTAQRRRLERVQDACVSVLEQFVGHKLSDGPPPSDDSVLHAHAWGRNA